jgi:hypothetical protein
MNEAVAYKDEVARIGLQRGPSGKTGLPYEYEHDEKSTVEQQPQQPQQPQHQNQKLSAVGRSSIYSINKLGLPQKSLLNYL